MASVADSISRGIGLDKILPPQEMLIKKNNEQNELMLSDYGDQLKVENKKLAELEKFKDCITKIKNAANILIDPLQSGFAKKISSLSTTDIGAKDDYITNVQVDNSVMNGDVKVAVQRAAVAAAMTLGVNQNNEGFAKNTSLNFSGKMTLNIDGTPAGVREINIVPLDKVEDIITKINQQFFNAGDKFVAFSVEGDNNTSFIEIRSKETGARNITVQYDVDLTAANIHTQNNQAGQDALVYINGIQRNQSSNKFIDTINGLSFELTGKANSVNNDPIYNNYNHLNISTISIKDDNKAAKDIILAFGNNLNELSFLNTKNDQTNRPVSSNQFSDPYTLFESFNDPISPLRGSTIMKNAKEVWERFISDKYVANGEISSFRDLGMGLRQDTKEVTDEDGNVKIISYDALYFEDRSKFDKVFSDDFEKVINFFVTNTKVKSNPANLSTVQFLPGEFDAPLTSTAVIGKDINVQAIFNNANELTNYTATVNNIIYQAKITKNPYTNKFDAKFDLNTPLSNLAFSVDPKTANGIENYVINYTPGIADLIRSDARILYNDDNQFKGIAVIETEIITDQVTKISKMRDQISKELKAETDKLESVYSMMEQFDVKFATDLAAVEAALGLDSN